MTLSIKARNWTNLGNWLNQYLPPGTVRKDGVLYDNISKINNSMKMRSNPVFF